RSIDIGETRAEQNVASESAEGVRSRIGKAGFVKIRVQFLALGAAGIEDRIARPDQVGTRGSGARCRVVGGPDVKRPPRHHGEERTQAPITQDRIRRRLSLDSGQIPDEGSDEAMSSRKVGIPAREEKVERIVDAAASAESVAGGIIQVF